MQILKYIGGLLPRIGRDRLEEDLRITRTAVETTAVTAYKRAGEAFSGGLKSSEGKDFEKYFFKNIKNVGNRGGGLIEVICQKLEDIAPTLQLCENIIEADFELDIVAAGITLKKAHVLRAVELAGFVATYSLRWLNYLYVVECEAAGARNHLKTSLSAGEIKNLTDHFPEFVTALNAISRPKGEIDKIFKDLPDVLVSERGRAALSTISFAKVDPLGSFAVQGFTYNPIYFVGKVVVLYQAERYKRNQELLAVLELRMLQLQKQRDGNPDPGLEREIEVVQSRIDDLSDKLRKDEESVQ